MDRFDEIREKALPLLEPYGLLKLGVFSSYARGDYGPESDLDLLVDPEGRDGDVAIGEEIHVAIHRRRSGDAL